MFVILSSSGVWLCGQWAADQFYYEGGYLQHFPATDPLSKVDNVTCLIRALRIAKGLYPNGFCSNNGKLESLPDMTRNICSLTATIQNGSSGGFGILTVRIH